MLRQARIRVEREEWANVEFVECDASAYAFSPEVGGILSTFALTLVPEYDALIEHGASALRERKRWVVVDLKMSNNIFRHLYPLLLPMFSPFGVTLGLAKRYPWQSIESHLGNVAVESYVLGFTYIACGKKVAETPSGESN